MFLKAVRGGDQRVGINERFMIENSSESLPELISFLWEKESAIQFTLTKEEL